MHLSKTEISILFFIIIIALLRLFFFSPDRLPYDQFVGKKVSVKGVITEAPDERLYNTRVTITPNEQDSSIIASIPKSSLVYYGDLVEVSGILEIPENFDTTSGKEFDYKNYLRNKNVDYLINKASINRIEGGHGSFIKYYLYKLRDGFMENIRNIIKSPNSDLAGGLILGIRGGFDQSTREEFVNTGTIHIIALSGYNVTIVAEGIMKVFGLILSSSLSIILGVFVIILFVLLSGASSTAVRAGIMASIALFARLTGRRYDAGRALVVAALVMIAYDPRVITDLSFLLSFSATFGVLFVTPKVVKWVWFIPMRFGFRELIATTIAANISVLPLILYSTGIFSIVSLPANILILPFIPIAMLLSFLVGMFGFISMFIAVPFSYLADLILSYILGVIHFFASLSFASVTIKSFPLVLVIILYLFILWWVFKKK